MLISSHGWRLLVSIVVSLGVVVIFSVLNILHVAWFNWLGQCFGMTFEVWWWQIDFITLSKGWSRGWWMSSHDMGCLLKDMLIIGGMGKVIMSWLEGYYCSILSKAMVMKSNNCLYLSLTDVSTVIIFLYMWWFLIIWELQFLNFYIYCNVWVQFDWFYFAGFVAYNLMDRVVYIMFVLRGFSLTRPNSFAGDVLPLRICTLNFTGMM